MNNVTSKLFIINKLATLSPCSLRGCSSLQNRNYSRPTSFPDYFQNPIFRKEEQAKLIETGEFSKITAVPVKPPGSHETSSVYHDPLVNKVINHVMEMGKKKLARSLVEQAFEIIKRMQIERYHLAATPEAKQKIELSPKAILYKAVENAKPLLLLSPIKRGGISYQVPGPITEKRSLFLAIKWLLEATNDKERTVHFPQAFAWELLDAANNTGKVVKRKQDLHRQCEANRAYAQSAALEERLATATAQLTHAHNHIMQLDARNKQLRAHIMSEASELKSEALPHLIEDGAGKSRSSPLLEAARPTRPAKIQFAKTEATRNLQLSPVQN